MVRRDKANYMIQSVSHALDVLEELSRAGGEIGVTELSKRLKLHKNNVFRLLATLELRGYVEQNSETEDYRLGVKSLELGQAYLTQSSLVARALPILKKLREELGETVSLAIMQNTFIQYPLSLEAQRPVKVGGRIAVSFKALECAAGRLLLAHLPIATLDELLASNSNIITIKQQLSELKQYGLTVDRAASEQDVVTIASIITGVNDSCVGCIEVNAPQYRAKVDEIVPRVQQASSELSTALGALPKRLAGSIERHSSSNETASLS